MRAPDRATRNGRTPWPPNFNVVAFAARAPVAFAIIYVVGRGLSSRNNIELRGQGDCFVGESSLPRRMGLPLFICDNSSLNSSLQWSSGPPQGWLTKAQSRHPWTPRRRRRRSRLLLAKESDSFIVVVVVGVSMDVSNEHPLVFV